MKNILKKMRQYKLWSTVILILISLTTYKIFFASNSSNDTRYIVGKVKRGTLISTVTGSGQVAVIDQLDIKPKVSGEITYMTNLLGQYVGPGSLIATLDSKTAMKAVRDAEVNLKSSELALEKLTQAADNLTLIQTEDALTLAKQNKVNSETTLSRAYDDGFTSVSNAYVNLPGIMQGLETILYGTTVARGAQDNISAYSDMVKGYDERVSTYKTDVETSYAAARTSYNNAYDNYKLSSRTDTPVKIELLINETRESVARVATAVKNTNNFLDFVEDRLTEHKLTIPSQNSAFQNSIDIYTTQTNTHLSTLLNSKTTIQNNKDSSVNSERSITEKQAALDKLKKGADSLDIESQKLTVTQRKNSLQDARDTLADYSIKAPFAGTIAKLPYQKGDSVGPSNSITTLVTKQKLAELSLNEVDVAKISLNQKTTLTFDAIEKLEIDGKVTEIDTIGTVTQGVVTYTVKISFATQDERIKPGMTVNASIITDVKEDVLLIPNSAVKNQNSESYVEILSNPDIRVKGVQGVTSKTVPTRKKIKMGNSNNTSTEIISGLEEGDQVIVRTISGGAKTAATQAPSLFGATGGNRGTNRTIGR